MNKKTLAAIAIFLAGGFLLGRYAAVGNREDEPGRERPAFQYDSPAPRNSLVEAAGGMVSVADVAEAVGPSLINISSVRFIEVRRSPFEYFFGDPFDDFFERFFDMPERRRREEPRRFRQEGTGSGFIVNEEGYALTNYHVVAGAEELQVTLYDDETYDAEVVGRDPRTDLAVVKINASRRFTPLPLGDSDKIRVGDAVMAAGSPFGLEQTFTAGIISARRQNVVIQGQNFGEMIQTDASINRGNSGGPLVDMHGRAIGINSAIFAPTGVFAGVGFAIPINRAVLILDQLIEVGRVVRGWLGVEIREVDEVIKDQFGLETADGALVNRVWEDTPARRGGIRRGDVIVEIDGRKVEAVRHLQDIIGAFSPGDTVTVTVIRDGRRQDLEVELGEMPVEMPVAEAEPEEEIEREETQARWKGIHVSNIDGGVRRRYDLTTDEGVVVVRVEHDAEAYGIGLRSSDVIRQINRRKINNVEDFKKATGEISLSDGVVFDILRNGQPVYLSYRRR